MAENAAKTENKKVLITGGAGFIGSTIASYCIDQGVTPIILDDLSAGLKQFTDGRIFYQGDISDKQLIHRIATEQGPIWGVIHCAAKIIVPESVEHPTEYYENNVSKSISLLEALISEGITRIVFSSTGSLYADNPELFVDESWPLEPHSPYSATKGMFERILADTAKTGQIKALAFRYFNPIGADPQFRTGLQNPHPTHVLGKMIEASNEDKDFTVTGVEWPTRDGSGLRDYIHIWDIARAHYLAIEKFDEVMASDAPEGFDVINLGTGTGSTVIELLHDYEEATGKTLNYTTGPARPGDVAGAAAVADKARELLGWTAELPIKQAIVDSITWSEKLPDVLKS